MSGISLDDLVISLPIPAHVKDCSNGQYVLSNKENLKVYHFAKITEMIGKTIHDLDEFMKPRWGEEFADSIDRLDESVVKTGKTFFYENRIFVAVDGILRVQDMTKLPVYGYQNAKKIIGILTHSHDKTEKINFKVLFNIYIEFYKRQEIISEYFCKFLRIKSLFYALPTNAEIKFLLYAQDGGTIADIAKKMNRSIKTCETHISHINEKLKNSDVREVIKFLRIFQDQLTNDVSH